MSLSGAAWRPRDSRSAQVIVSTARSPGSRDLRASQRVTLDRKVPLLEIYRLTPSPPWNPRVFAPAPAGDASVENYTVMHLKGVPDRGILLGRLAASGERFIANFEPDRALLHAIEAQDAVGMRGVVARAGDLNIFRPHPLSPRP